MTNVTVNEGFQPYKFLIVSRKDEDETISTTRVVVSDDNVNQIRVINIEQGPVGEKGDTGAQGPAGIDAPTFDILSIASGGTNNNSFSSGNIIYYDGTSLSSTAYSIQDILNQAGSSNSVTGVLAGSGLTKTDSNNTVTLNTVLGEGLTIGANNEILVDGTIARLSDLDLGTIQGQVPISKGGTNNNFYTQNRLVYYDGTKIKSFPMDTGNFVFSGVSVDVVAGSGLVGGGNLSIPNGSVVINIPSSADILVEENLISLSNTGVAGTYSKVTTDDKGRVVSGTALTEAEIVGILGYAPYHAGNDGPGSNLNADLLDNQQGSYYTDASNLTGTINTNVLPSAVVPGTYTKVAVGSGGLVTDVYYANQDDIISSLGYTPVPNTGSKTIYGDTTFTDNVTLNGDDLEIYDHLPLLATDNPNILPDTPRGISFVYGGIYSNKTGLLAYYPAEDELKLVTNVFASGSDIDGDGDSDYQDDINGGNAEAVFVLQNLDGDASTILLRHIADTLYVNTSTDENINGLKTFLDGIVVRKQISITNPPGNPDPPLDVSNNTNTVINLSSDLLDGEHGDYYTDAQNMTGAFSYENVTFDHIQGTHNYIPRFNDTEVDPARKINNSSLYQDNYGNIIVDEDRNLSVGPDSNMANGVNSLSVGNNTLESNKSLAVGSNNTASGDNSLALNEGSVTKARNSIALGSYGITNAPNQIAFGAFNLNDANNNRLEHAQQTITNLHLAGTEIGNTWTTLEPSIELPTNKTIAYNAEILITKAFGTGVAHFKFESGIYKNATFRDSNNLVNIINVSTQPQASKKIELFNNSQIKNHYHTFTHTNQQAQIQDVRVTHPPLQYNTSAAENIEDYYFYSKIDKHVSGRYLKTNDGDLQLDINKPLYDALFYTDTDYRGLKIISKDHGVTAGSEATIIFETVSGFPIASGFFDVYSVTNKDTFFAELPRYTGYISYYAGTGSYDYADISINQHGIRVVDNQYIAKSSGTIDYNGSINKSSLDNHILINQLRKNSIIVVQSGDLLFNRLVSDVQGSYFTLNEPLATGQSGTYNILSGPVDIYYTDYVHTLFRHASKLQIDTTSDGAQTLNLTMEPTGVVSFQDKTVFGTSIDFPAGTSIYSTGDYYYPTGSLQNINTSFATDFYSLPSLSITGIQIPKRSSYPTVVDVVVSPLLENSGTAYIHHKKTIGGDFVYRNTEFDPYECVYVKNKNNNTITVYETGLRPLRLPYTPTRYALVAGPYDDDNDSFEIINTKDIYYLTAKDPLDYETKNIYNIRLRAYSNENEVSWTEENFTITVNDTRAPYSHINIPDHTIDISDTFDYTIPNNIFNEENNEGPLSITASSQNGDPLPSWLSFDSNTLNFNGTPSGCDLGTYNIRVFAENNFSEIYQDFYLTVTDNQYQTSDLTNSYFGGRPDLTDIILSSSNIDENLPSGSIVCQLSHVGSYDPYLSFDSASNSFSGIFVNGSDIVECLAQTFDYDTVSISGSSDYLTPGDTIETASSLNLDNTTAINVYKPFMLSGTPGLTDGNIYLSYADYTNTFYSGMTINTSGDEFPQFFTAENFSDYYVHIGERTVLASETGLFELDQLNTEDGYDIVTKHSPFPYIMLSMEGVSLSTSGILAESSGNIIVSDPFSTNITWATGYPNCDDRDLIENTLVSFTPRPRDYNLTIDTSGELDNFNAPPQSGLKRSNIKYDTDTWSFRDSIENPVLAMYDLGSAEFGGFTTEDDNPLYFENNDRFISTEQKHHGTRIELWQTYELLDAYEVAKDNGRLMTNNIDSFVTEDNQAIVYDYAIAARSGDVCLLFPGTRQGDFTFNYEEDVDLLDNTYNYYYNWGKMIPFVFSSSKSFIRMSQKYTGTNRKSLIKHTLSNPLDDNYAISGIRSHDYATGEIVDCEDVLAADNMGFESTDFSLGGSYATGLVKVYSKAGFSTVDLNFDSDVNLDERDRNNLYVYNFQSSSSFDLPPTRQYPDVEISDRNTVGMYNFLFLMPDSGTNYTGSFVCNLDENHGYQEELNTIINRVPVEFTNSITTLSGIDTDSTHRPKDYTFDVLSVNGNKISAKDNLNYLLKEQNRPDYYEQSINAKYITNGIAFSGSFFHKHKNIYDIRNGTANLNTIHKTVPYRYYADANIFTFDIPPSLITHFDDVSFSFTSGNNYHISGFQSLITEATLSAYAYNDLEPYKDSLLLETSNVEPSQELVSVSLKESLRDLTQNNAVYQKDIQSSCTIDNSIINRLQPGFFINYQDSPIVGYQIDALVSGFDFDGFIPRYNNVLSSTNLDSLIDNNHVGHASVFNSGSGPLLSGTRLLRKVNSDEIGYNEYYFIGSNQDLLPSNFSGIGSVSSPYHYKINQSGNQPSQYLEFLYLGQNANTVKITGIYTTSSGVNTLNIYKIDLENQKKFVQLSPDYIHDSHIVFSTGTSVTGVNQKIPIDVYISVSRSDKILIDMKPTTGNHISAYNNLQFGTFVTSTVTQKPYLLESDVFINEEYDFLPPVNPTAPSLIFNPTPTLNSDGCLDCNTNLPQYIPSIAENYDEFVHGKFKILPYIKTNTTHCTTGVLSYEKNKDLFFNGNIIDIRNLETQKSFLEKDNEILVKKFNNVSVSDSTHISKYIHKYNPTSGQYNISGIAINGEKILPPILDGTAYPILFENEYRYNAPLGITHNALLPNSGSVEFIKTQSGQINVYDYNNLYYHTYGGTTSRYPLDDSGKNVPVCQTGTYHVVNNVNACASGTLCVIVSGYRTNAFANITDISNRQEFGKQSPVVDYDSHSGVVKRFGVDKKMYFDFVDGFEEISDVYYIQDLLSPNILSISIPYRDDYVARSGLVYIIDSDDNIKSHLNPNLDNQFQISNGTMGGLSSVNKKVFNYFDNDAKRWKHTVHLHGDQPESIAHDITLASTPAKLISINPDPVIISGISYSTDGNTFSDVSGNLNISDRYGDIYFRVTTLHGDQELFSQQLRPSMPKLAISGLANCAFIFDEPGLYGYHGSGWNIGVRVTQPEYNYQNKQTVFRVSDNTGYDESIVNISKKQSLDITSAYTGFVATGNAWQLVFDVTNIDLDSSYIANNIMFSLSDTPVTPSADIKYIDDTTIVFTGYAGNTLGTYYPELVITDLTTAPYEPLATGTSTLVVMDHISSRPEYVVSTNNLKFNYEIDLSELQYIEFQIPAELGPVPNEVLNSLNLTFNHNSNYDILLYSSSYNSDTKRFEIIGKPTNSGNTIYLSNPGRYVNQSVSISLKQPVYDEYGNYTYQTYSNNFAFNTVFYKNIDFQHIAQNPDLVFNTDEPWSVEFYVLSGINQFDPSSRPNVSIFNTPNIGNYESSPIEYTLDYEYDTELNKWKVTAVGTKDYFGRYVDSTGITPISIYVDDGVSYLNKYDYTIEYRPITLMKNIPANVYATPDNEFFTKADYYDLNEISVNSIYFLSSLKEDSIQLYNPVRKYDRDLNMWQNAYTSHKMTDKYDARLIIQDNELSLSCQGIGKDKVIAMAKLETMEIESNEIAGLPLTITGVQDYGLPSGIIVQNPSGWTLEFKTFGGLAHPNYPPTILLEDMPTFCTGYNPLIETQLQCLTEEPQWDPNDFGGSWSFSFSGLPSCTLLGIKDFKITAIDTDPGLLPNSPYLPQTDDVDHFFTYLETLESGLPPAWSQDPDYEDSAVIKPACNIYYRNRYNFGPAKGGQCVGPTGIKSYTITGDVPSGLSYSIFFPSENQDNTPVEPYSNLGSGYVHIEGYPLQFSPNEDKTYDEKLYYEIIDARDLVTSGSITFIDTSEPFEPDVGIAVYFAENRVALTPSIGLKIIDEPLTEYWRPPPIAETVDCNTRLPVNNCYSFECVYSGNIGLDTRIFFTQPEQEEQNKIVVAGDNIYIRFDDSNNSDLNGSYTVFSSEDGIYIDQGTSLTVQNTGSARIVKGSYITDTTINSFDELFPEGNIVHNTTKCILGGGRADYGIGQGDDPKRSIVGAVLPSHQAFVSGLIPFSSEANTFSGLSISGLNNSINDIDSVVWLDCYQTGYLHISGIIVPPIHAEIVDPPPAQDYYFSYNGARFALATRLAFGETEIQRLLLDNERTGRSLSYTLTDLLDENILQSGSVGAGSSFNTVTLSTASGTVYKISIEHQADIFPSLDIHSLPYSYNEYVWVHKGDNLSIIPTQNTFPGIIPVGFDSISVINDLDDEDPNGVVMDPIYGIALGGYIPTDDGIGVQVPYSHTGSPPAPWSVADYAPRISGTIQELLTKSPINSVDSSYLYSYTYQTGEITISSSDIGLEANDIILLDFYKNDGSLQFSSGLIVDNPNNDIIIPNINLGIGGFQGYSNITFGCKIIEVDTNNNQIVMEHNNISYTTGTPICIDKNLYISSELALLENPGEIHIASGTTGVMYLYNTNLSDTTWHNGFASGDLVSLYNNIDDNIKIMPYNTSYVTEGKYTFQITGRSNTRENEDLIYKVSTMENPDMPIFDSGTYPNDCLIPKKTFKNFALHINKPISIITGTVVKNGDQLTFSIFGGKRPIYENTPDIQIAAGTNAFGYCGFFRYSTDQILKDEYDSVNDRLNVRMTLSSEYGIDWSLHSSVRIRVSDETGSDEFTYNY